MCFFLLYTGNFYIATFDRCLNFILLITVIALTVWISQKNKMLNV